MVLFFSKIGAGAPMTDARMVRAMEVPMFDHEDREYIVVQTPHGDFEFFTEDFSEEGLLEMPA